MESARMVPTAVAVAVAMVVALGDRLQYARWRATSLHDGALRAPLLPPAMLQLMLPPPPMLMLHRLLLVSLREQPAVVLVALLVTVWLL